MNSINDIKIKGLDPNRRPSLKNKKYIDIFFELTHKAPQDWCSDFNLLFSKNSHRAKIIPEEGLFIETYVRDMMEIPDELDLIKENLMLCNSNYIEQKHQEELTQQKSESSKISSQNDKLEKILSSLRYD